MATKFLLSIAVCTLLVVYTAANLPIKACDSNNKGKVKSVTLDPPPRPDGCTFPKGSNVTAHVTFDIGEVTQKLNVVVKGQVVVWVKFPLPNPDACKQGVTCPTTADTNYTFSTGLQIDKSYPSLRLLIKMEFYDDSGSATPALCVEFPGAICDA